MNHNWKRNVVVVFGSDQLAQSFVILLASALASCFTTLASVTFLDNLSNRYASISVFMFIVPTLTKNQKWHYI